MENTMSKRELWLTVVFIVCVFLLNEHFDHEYFEYIHRGFSAF